MRRLSGANPWQGKYGETSATVKKVKVIMLKSESNIMVIRGQPRARKIWQNGWETSEKVKVVIKKSFYVKVIL